MTSYRYRALTPAGAVVSGYMDAASQADVIRQMRAVGHYPISAEEAKNKSTFDLSRLFEFTRRNAARRQLAMATLELSTLLKAGIALEAAIGMLEQMSDLDSLASPLGKIRERLRGGRSLSDALEGEPDFPKFYVSMVRAGEISGTLDDVLLRLAEYLSAAAATRDAIDSALTYPIILLCTAGLSILFILLFVLPEFERLFTDAGRELPLATKLIIAFVHVLRGYWWLIAGVTAAGIWVFGKLMEREENKRRRDTALLRLPLLGELLLNVEVERFARVFATLLQNGVTVPIALPLAADATSNALVRTAILEAADGVREGEALAPRLARANLFPPATIDNIRVGEESSKLDQMLLHHADMLARRIKHQTDRLLAMLVPALTILLGVLIGGLIASMLSAILSINDLAM